MHNSIVRSQLGEIKLQLDLHVLYLEAGMGVRVSNVCYTLQ